MFVKGIFGEGEGYNGMALFVSTKINEHRIGLKNEKTNMVLNFILYLYYKRHLQKHQHKLNHVNVSRNT